ncbi:MAG: hypothetical protein WC325_01825 [Candidatus Bathyarchaeia archaeon]|jgi:hypothetical protein
MPFLDPVRNAIFGKAVDKIWGRLEPNQVPSKLQIQPEPIQPNKAYLNIVLRSMRIVNVRVVFQKLYGVVHSYATLPIYATEEAKFNVVTTPTNLKDIDKNHLDRVIQGDKELLGPVPYRGGKIQLELGLFAVHSENLLDSYLTLLGELADAASVDYVRQAIPFVAPIQKGISMLLGVGGPSTLLVGLQSSLDPVTGHYVVTDAEKTSNFNLRDLKLGEDYCLYTKDGKAFNEHPYMVFSVYSTPIRDTWFDIPDLGTAFANLRLAIKSGTPKSIKENHDIFAKAVLSSPDLLIQDAKRIVDEVYTQMVEPLVPAEPTKTPMVSPLEFTMLNIPETMPKTRRTPTIVDPKLLSLLNIPKTLKQEDRQAAINLAVFKK